MSAKHEPWDPEAILVRNSLDRMLEGLQIIGRDWRYLYVNEEITRQCRLPREALVGRTMREVFPGIERTPLFRMLEECMSRRTSRSLENEFQHADGEVGWFAISIEPAEPGLLVRSVEITERKRAERELREHAEALERSNAALEQYAYVAAHDLRGPLRQVATLVQLIREELGDSVSPSVDERLRYVLDAIAKLRALVSDLLEYAKLDGHAGSFREVDLGRSVDEALEALAGTPGLERASFEIGALPAVRSHPTLARTLLANLIANALKFSSEREAPEIRVHASEGPDHVRVEVQDNGVGIDPELQERVFRLFERGHHAGRFPGRGIGLATCRRIMELHGGEVGVESRANAGARFWVVFPQSGR